MPNKMAISKFLIGDFGKKTSVGRGLGELQFFGHLGKELELLIPVRTSLFMTF